MKTRNICLLIFTLMMLVGCNVPKTNQNKNTINYVNNKKPNGEYITLRIGEYKAVTDIKPGRYFVYKEKVNDDNNTHITIFDENRNALNNIYPRFDTPSIEIIEGRVYKISNGSIVLSTEYVPIEDFYEIKDPGGTIVPKGTFHIGTDIPAGSYELYPITFNGARGAYIADEETYEAIEVNGEDYKKYELKVTLIDISFNGTNYGQLFYFPEGSVFIIDDSIKMKKVDTMKFE